jgi:hypothetical protein
MHDRFSDLELRAASMGDSDLAAKIRELSGISLKRVYDMI